MNVTATLPGMAYADLYINDQQQASGIAASVPVVGASTTISVKVAPYFMKARTYTITVLKDVTPPGVNFETNGKAAPARTASTKVTVTGTENIGDPSLEYVWTTSTDAPTLGWEPFSNSHVLTRTSGDGSWYLHVRAVDRDGEVVAHAVSDAFVLDNTAPVIRLNGSDSMRVQVNSVFSDPGAKASDLQDGDLSSAITVTGVVYTHSVGTYELNYNVKDTAGNEAEPVTRTVEVYRATTGGGGNPAPTTKQPYIDVNGTALDPKTVDTAKPSVTLEVSPNHDGMAYVGIPASVLVDIADQNSGFIIVIKTPYGSYQVPVNLASIIPGLNDLLAANNLNSEEISFKITLTDKSGNKEIKTALATGLPQSEVLGAIVDFNIEIVNTKTGQSIGPSSRFNKTLTRIIPLPKNNRLAGTMGRFPL